MHYMQSELRKHNRRLVLMDVMEQNAGKIKIIKRIIYTFYI